MKKVPFLLCLVALLVSISIVFSAGGLQINIINEPESAEPGQTTSFSFEVFNGEEYEIKDLEISVTDLEKGSDKIDSNYISLSTNLIESLEGNSSSEEISGDIEIPDYQPSGTYTGTIIVDDGDSNETEANVSVTVNELKALDVLDYDENNALVVTMQEDEVEYAYFKIKNTGNVVINPTISHDINLETNDENISLDFGNLGEINPGEERQIEIRIETPRDAGLGEYKGIVSVSDDEVSDSFKLEIRIQPDLCEEGPKGGHLRIKDIDFDQDEYKPGDTINIDVEVENRANDDIDDVIVEAFLYNIDKNKELDSFESEPIDINEDEKETFNIELEVPYDNDDLDSRDELAVYFKVYEDDYEDEQCYEAKEDIDLNLERHDILIKKVSFLPETAECGELVTARISVYNIGEKDEDVIIALKESRLGIEEETSEFSLDKFDDRNYDALKTLSFKIPEDAEEGNYNVRIIATFDNGDEVRDTFETLKVVCEAKTEEEEKTATAEEEGEETTGEEKGDEEETPITGAATYLPTRRFDKETMTTILFIIGDVVLLIIAIYFITLIFRRR